MTDRLTDTGYLTALGHNAIEGREERLPDATQDLLDFEYDTLEIFSDLGLVQLSLGQHTVEEWFIFYGDEDTFTGGVSFGPRALMMGHLYNRLVPSGWSECPDCLDGCPMCQYLAIVPSDMVELCPACDGDGKVRHRICGRCNEGIVWSSEADDIRIASIEEDAYRASEREDMWA